MRIGHSTGIGTKTGIIGTLYNRALTICNNNEDRRSEPQKIIKDLQKKWLFQVIA